MPWAPSARTWRRCLYPTRIQVRLEDIEMESRYSSGRSRIRVSRSSKRRIIQLALGLLALVIFVIWALRAPVIDTDPLPWRAYCSMPSISRPPHVLPGIEPDETRLNSMLSFPPSDLDDIPPVGVFIGMFTKDESVERRAMVRDSFASHPRSRNGAGLGDHGAGTSKTIVRFIIGRPRRSMQRQVDLEMQLYNDIVILPIAENMNRGKTHAFFTWAASHAWVPHYNLSEPATPAMPPQLLAPHDPELAWEHYLAGNFIPWVRPDFVVKMDDDTFLMLAELEARLRVELRRPVRTNLDLAAKTSDNKPLQDPMVYWGYLVCNELYTFIAGEVYALSWNLVQWAATDPAVKAHTAGAEDKVTAHWIRNLHPNASSVHWATERCWIYDHPKAPSIYAHGFLFPSEVDRVRVGMHSPVDMDDLLTSPAATNLGMDTIPRAWARSTTSTFKVPYSPPIRGLNPLEHVEALVEGSDMSQLTNRPSSMSPTLAWAWREGRQKRYKGQRVGGTVAVHYVKHPSWWTETATALLSGPEIGEWD